MAIKMPFTSKKLLAEAKNLQGKSQSFIKDYELHGLLREFESALKKRFRGEADESVISAYFVNSGAFYSISHVLATQALRTQTRLNEAAVWSSLQVDSMLICL